MSGSKNKANNQTLKAAWLRQLNKAYQNLIWQHKLKVAPASLGLMTGLRTWGRWEEKDRLILINEELFKFSWPSILGILGHELAHQMVSELVPPKARRNENPHGPLFVKMGTSLGINPFYLTASVNLRDECPKPWPSRDGEQLDEKNAKILSRVQKLLALSSSPVAAEAEAALSAAARLMARHNLENIENSPETGSYEARVIEILAKRIDTRLRLLTHIISRHFFVQTIFVPSYDPTSDTEGYDLELLGRPENTRLAEHVFYFLMERSESLWKAWHKEHRGGGLTARNSFIHSLLSSFSQKLDQAAVPKNSNTPGSSAGVSALTLVQQDQGLQDFYHQRHPQVRKTRSVRRHYNPIAGEAGAVAGKALNFNRPLAGDSASTAKAPLALPDSKPATRQKNETLFWELNS